MSWRVVSSLLSALVVVNKQATTLGRCASRVVLTIRPADANGGGMMVTKEILSLSLCRSVACSLLVMFAQRRHAREVIFWSAGGSFWRRANEQGEIPVRFSRKLLYCPPR